MPPYYHSSYIVERATQGGKKMENKKCTAKREVFFFKLGTSEPQKVTATRVPQIDGQTSFST